MWGGRRLWNVEIQLPFGFCPMFCHRLIRVDGRGWIGRAGGSVAMKITALLVLKLVGSGEALSSGQPDPLVLPSATDVSQFGFYPPGDRLLCRARHRQEDSARPAAVRPTRRLAYTQQNIFKVLDECQRSFGESWRTVQADVNQPWPYLNKPLTKFQDPAEADKLLKIQRDLDETKIILHKTIDSVLARGEKLYSLVEKSSDLSAASQMFYKQAIKSNQCCTIL